MRTYWDAFVEDHPRSPDESDAAYLERFYSWLSASTVPTKYQQRIADLEAKLAEAQHQEAASFQALCESEAKFVQAREALERCLTRLKTERDMISGAEPTLRLDPKVHGMDALIPLMEAALGTGKEEKE